MGDRCVRPRPVANGDRPATGDAERLNRHAWSVLDRALARTGRPLDEVIQRAGSTQRGLPLFRARSPLLHLVACSPSIISVPSDLPQTTRVTGAWLDRSTPPPLPAKVTAFVADVPAPIILAFGSMAGAPENVMDHAVRAMLEAGRRVIVQGAVAGTASSPNLLRLGPVDHRALFARAGLVIHHGGAGTTHAACAAGVPSLVVPHVGDQRYWADRLHRLGAAPEPQPVKELRANRLAEAALAAVSDPTVRHHAHDLAQAMREEDGLRAALRFIESIGA